MEAGTSLEKEMDLNVKAARLLERFCSSSRAQLDLRKAISKESVQEQSAVDKVEAEIATEKERRKHLLQDVADMRIRRFGLEDRLAKVIFVFLETIWSGLMNLNCRIVGIAL